MLVLFSLSIVKMDNLEEVHQDEQSYDANCSRTTKHDFVKISKKTSTKCFEEKSSKDLNNFVQSGKSYFVNI